MCGRYTLASDVSDFLAALAIDVPDALAHPRRYNIAPSQPVLGIVADPLPRAEVMVWGFLPSWAKPDKGMKPVINARVESIREGKPFYRGAFVSGRCAILADGFYEWKRMGKGKQPYRIQLRDRGVFAMAGLWSWYRSADGAEQATCAIVTVAANDFMRDIHDRMPAILREDDLGVWLDPTSRQLDLFSALEPYDPAEMSAFAVSTTVNSPANDNDKCIEPLTEDEF
jgi:putative SOS response-associated peptidase YedK